MKNRSAFRRDVTCLRNQLMNLSRRMRREAQSGDRSWARLRLLGAIARAADEATPTKLAESESMRPSNLAAALRDLEADGFILRAADAEDRRKVRVRLTPTGREVLRKTTARHERWLREAIETSLTGQERALLFRAGKLLDRLAAYSGSGPFQLALPTAPARLISSQSSAPMPANRRSRTQAARRRARRSGTRGSSEGPGRVV